MKAVDKLRARGVQIVFVRAPSSDDYLAYKDRYFPGYDLPEWSHLSAREKPRYTEALFRILVRDVWRVR